MKKTTFATFAFAALAALALVPTAHAVGDEGDIRSIQAMPIADYDPVTGNANSPLGVGETFYVRVRLLNQNWQETSFDATKTHAWVFERNGTALPSNLNDVLYRPALQLAIGSKLVAAEFAYSGPGGASSGLNGENSFYTDLYFAYTVKEGELGQPVRFVNAAGKIVNSIDDMVAGGFNLLNVTTAKRPGVGYWTLTNDLGGTVSFWYGLVSPEPNPTDFRPYPAEGVSDIEHMPYDKVYPGIYVKTIDFVGDDGDVAPGVWRQVYQGLDDEVGKTVALKGTGPTTVYVWSENDKIAKPIGEVDSSVTDRTVIKVTLRADGEPVTFKLLGGTAAVESTCKIYVCSDKNPAKNGAGDVLTGSTLERTVQLVGAPDPFITIARASDGARSGISIEATANYQNAVQMRVSFSKTYDSAPTKVKLNANVNGTPLDPAKMYVKVLTNESGDPTVDASVDEIVIPAGQKDGYFYVFPLGSNAELKSTGITFDPTTDNTAFDETKRRAAVVKVTDQTPVIDQLAVPASAAQGDTIDIDVMLKDNWRDLQKAFNTNGYKVVIGLNGSKVVETNTVFFAEEDATTFSVTVPTAAADVVNGYVRVWDATHTRNSDYAERTFTLTVSKKPEFTATPYFFASAASDAPRIYPGEFCEGEAPVVRVVLSQVPTEDVYAFLTLDSNTPEGVVDTNVLSQALLISKESQNPTNSAPIALKLLDGDALTPHKTTAKLKVELKDGTGPSANTVSTYDCKSLLFDVTNAVPSVSRVWKGTASTGTRIDNGAAYTGSLPAGSPVLFTALVKDPGVSDVTNTAMPIRVMWVWTDGPEGSNPEQTPVVTNITTKGYSTCPITFYEEGSTQTVKLYAQDKDMRAVDEDEFGELLYTFTVKVGKQPSVKLEYPQGNSEGLFYENGNKKNNAIIVKLSDWPASTDHASGDPAIGTTANPVRVKLTVDDDYHSDKGVLKLVDPKSGVATNEAIVTFSKIEENTKGVTVYFDLDTQNGGDELPSMFMINAAVVNETKNQYDTPWKDYYGTADIEVDMMNVKPTITLASGDSHTFGATNVWTAGETVKLNWTVKDTKHDLTSGVFKVSWTLRDKDKKDFKSILSSSVTGTVLAGAATGTYEFVVPDGELTEVVVTANDGEGGTADYVFYIKVVPSKKIAVNVFGPSDSSETKYGVQPAGLGRGHVYFEGSTGKYIAREHKQTWNYGEAAQQAEVFAVGYPAAETNAYDNGRLDTGYTGAELTQAGYNWVSGTHAETARYNYGLSTLDNFFYTWAIVGGGDKASEVEVFTPNPAKQQSTIVGKLFDLDNEKDENKTGYKTVQVEAIFSQELLPSDNLGDINADYIPDLWVKQLGMGVYTDNQLTGDDLKSLETFNEDGDYFPNTDTASFAGFVPGLSNTWVTAGRAFTARLELRGYGDALNDATADVFPDGAKNRIALKGVKIERHYTDPTADEESTLTYLEYVAYTNWCGRQATPVDPEDKENWALWSPERPTNPTVDDTDGDGLTDAYEYYFWYKAHVGEFRVATDDDGNLVTNYVRMTGRRYNPANPCEPKEISADEIEALYDPIVTNKLLSEADSDHDGLPDLIELEIGTNPFDYDTDGDGLPDGWEVTRSETDPLKVATYKSPMDDALNRDGDRMAAITIDGWAVDYVVTNETTAVTNTLFALVEPKTQENAEDPAVTNLVAAIDLYSTYVYGRPEPDSRALGQLVYAAADEKQAAKALALNVVAVRALKNVRALHFQVLAIKGFDPRTAWNAPNAKETHIVDTAAFTAYDEFMLYAFFINTGVLNVPGEGLASDDLITIWTEYTTDPNNADTDADNMPDGWELYIMGQGLDGRNAVWIYSPLFSFEEVAGDELRDPDRDGLDFVHEFAGVEACARYADCETIFNVHPEWQNKIWPTDPFNGDTDGDGLSDGGEYIWLWGVAPGVAPDYNAHGADFEDCINGGGLNPCSWDTDNDRLPDPWEVEFMASYTLSSTTTTVETQETTNGTTSVTNSVTTGPSANLDGMNPTAKDLFEDYDHDGLNNWQEYMVGAMRCWRYDDTTSPWTGHKVPEPANGMYFSDEQLYGMIVNYWGDQSNARGFESDDNLYNPGFKQYHFDPGVYFSCCPNAFDLNAFRKFYMLRDGIYHDLATDLDAAGNNRWTAMVANMPALPLFMTFNPDGSPIHPTKYITCDPTMADTDGDGMDDYYELYHGLNPLLGASGISGKGVPRDIVYQAYSAQQPLAWDAHRNFWLNGDEPATGPMAPWSEEDVPADAITSLNFYQFPWLAGLPDADADGDNIRNQQEAILVNIQAAATYQHIDPSPLWFTDSTYTNSLTTRFYLPENPLWSGILAAFRHTGPTFEGPDGTVYRFDDFPWLHWDPLTQLVSIDYDVNIAETIGSMFSYEENEGYDTDHDYLGDYEESQSKTKNASSPQDHDDPIRHQAMWFNGQNAFLQTPLSQPYALPAAEARAEFRQNFLYFTAEAWVKPDAATIAPNAGLKTVLERAIVSGEANPGDASYLRKNFLLGIKNGRWYAKFDTTGTDYNQPVEITDGPEAAEKWTHVAVTYGPDNDNEADGSAPLALKLYVDGVCRKTVRTALQPEHGAAALILLPDLQQAGGNLVWSAMPPYGKPVISILVGASAVTATGVVFNNEWETRNAAYITPENPHGLNLFAPSTLADYGHFFGGYIDEVRIWDGARSASAIQSDVVGKVRYDAKRAAENRQSVFATWAQGARRTPVSANGLALPAELMYHWSFDHLPGAIEADDVIQGPGGFLSDRLLLDAKAPWSRPSSWDCAWWATSYIRSSVYADAHWVPWINNTVSHLPCFDGTTADSVYWSEDFAGDVAGYYPFPRTAEPYSRATQQFTAGDAQLYGSQATRWNLVKDDETLANRYLFTNRNREIEGKDLLPMGGAFPKRISSAEGGMWDDPGASDAWAQTGEDADNNGLPDWWELYATYNYMTLLGPVNWDTTVLYHGVEMPAGQAYLRDLAAGMVVIGGNVEIRPEYADTRDMDGDGLPDWWENLYGINTNSKDDADADPDHDGLSNYQEYLISEVYPEKYRLAALGVKSFALDPTKDRSSLTQQVTDYFLRYTVDAAFDVTATVTNTAGKTVFKLNEYFGEIATDHDFMEDWWELAMGSDYANAKVFDPYGDKDEDGWNNWAEVRAAIWGGFFTGNLIDKWTGSDSSQHIACYPEPIVGVKVTYHGTVDISGQPLVVRTMSGQTPRVDATFVVPAEASGQTRYIGAFNADGKMRGHLSPGHVNPSTIVFECARTSSDKTYTWSWANYDADGLTHPLQVSGSFDEYRSMYLRYPRIELVGADFEWQTLGQAIPSADQNAATILLDGSTVFGSVNAVTGEYELDMTKFTLAGGAKQYVYRVTYVSRIGHEWPQTVYLSDTRELSTGGEGAQGNGHVREGKNTIEAFIDLDGDGFLSEGEPYGAIRNVQVGWHKVPTVVIELKDVSPIMPSVQLGGAADGGLTKTVQVIRELINDEATKRLLLTKTVVLDDRAYLTEADACSLTKPDLDWTWLTKDAERMGVESIDSATYAVYEYDPELGTNTTLLAAFTKNFPKTRPVATAVEPKESQPVYASSPTLSFSASDATATAYRLQIRMKGATTPIYDSGIALLPGRVGSTVGAATYDVTPPVYAGAPVYTGTTTQHETFVDGTNYEWRVALYGAKFNTTTDDKDTSKEWSTWATFQMDVANANRDPDLPTGYGTAKVVVRYFGPATCSADKVIVEAYENADFRGPAMAQTRLADASKLAETDDIKTYNAVLRGLKPGQVFIRAFYDQNDNGVKDKWETWGYANQVGKGYAALYNPEPLTITTSTGDWVLGSAQTATVFMEDCDVNKNETPDCEEPEKFPEEAEADESDPVDWWEWAEADEADVTDGDVMAYYKTSMYLVSLWDGSKTATIKSFLLDDEKAWVPVAGTSAEGLKLATCYEYGASLYGYGLPETNVQVDATMKVYGTPKLVNVVYVHAQVREKFGFSSDTAVPGGKTNTKAFTAEDKRLVLRYQENTGRITADLIAIATNANYSTFEDYVFNSGNEKLYNQFTLKPSVTDSDNDGIDDGWELYVDANALSAADRETDDDKDGLKLWQEYDKNIADGTAIPTDPWSIDSDGDGVTDTYAYAYHLKGEEAGKDYDGDGLSNYAEYLITEVFKFAKCDPDRYATGDDVCDYFKKVGDLYLGEIFTDHDQMDDLWEAGYDVDFVNRYVYDAHLDTDGDGWSNYAEAMAGTDPTVEETISIDGYKLAEYPVPAVKANVVYNGSQVIKNKLVFKAWNETTDFDMVKSPDAIWTIGTGVEANGNGTQTGNGTQAQGGMALVEQEKFLGKKPSGTRTYHLSGGAISEGSVKLLFLDKGFGIVTYDPTRDVFTDVEAGEPDDAQWFYGIYDNNGQLVRLGNALDTEEAVVGSVDYKTGTITIDFDHEENSGRVLAPLSSARQSSANGGNNNGNAQANANTYALLDLDNSYVLISWKSAKVGSATGTYYLTDSDPISDTAASHGHLREGLNSFVCFVDTDDDGEYTPGELFGVARGVDIGWAGGSFDIELTETHPIFGRVDMEGNNDRAFWYGINSGNLEVDNLVDDGTTEGETAALTGKLRVRVDRYAVNGIKIGLGADQVYVPNRVVVDKWIDLGVRSYIHEGDVIEPSEFDIDWSHFDEIANARAMQIFEGGVQSVSYRIVIDNEGFVNPIASNRVLNVAFTRQFDLTRQKATLRPMPIVYGARPTFRWTMGKYNSYTAFKLRVLDKQDAIVYESAMTRVPPLDAKGDYVWTAPFSVGDQTPQGKVLARAGDFKWCVSMYNAKFKTDAFCDPAPFSTAVGQYAEADDMGYGAISAAVKYAGPQTVLDTCENLTTTTGIVRIQAFETPDFAGVPAAEGFVTNKAALVNTRDVTANATLYGLKAGTYYVRAFIDTNGNFAKDAWESWGKAKGEVTVTAGTTAEPVAVWIEDADTDGDWIPDAYEIVKEKSLDMENASVAENGQIVLKSTTYTSVTNGTANISTLLSGASMTLFENLTAAKLLLGLGLDAKTNTIAAIRAAVEKKVDPQTVKVTSLVVDAANAQVLLTVGAEVSDSIAGSVLSTVYQLSGGTAKVTVKIYRKKSLVEKSWGDPVEKKTYTISRALNATIKVPVDSDLTSGFYKVEVVQ